MREDQGQHVIGDRLVVSFVEYQADGVTPRDWTGYTTPATANVVEFEGDEDVLTTMDVALTAGGVWTATLTPAKSALLTGKVHLCAHVRITNAGGTLTETLCIITRRLRQPV